MPHQPCTNTHASRRAGPKQKAWWHDSTGGCTESFSFHYAGRDGVNLYDAYIGAVRHLEGRHDPMYDGYGTKVTYIVDVCGVEYKEQKYAQEKRGTVKREKAVKQIAQVVWNALKEEHNEPHDCSIELLKEWDLIKLERVNKSAFVCILRPRGKALSSQRSTPTNSPPICHPASLPDNSEPFEAHAEDDASSLGRGNSPNSFFFLPPFADNGHIVTGTSGRAQSKSDTPLDPVEMEQFRGLLARFLKYSALGMADVHPTTSTSTYNAPYAGTIADLEMARLPRETPQARFEGSSSSASISQASLAVQGEAREPVDPAEPIFLTLPQFSHLGVSCDGCDEDVVGVRHKCLECEDFDFCGRCITTDAVRSQHDPDHQFFPIKRLEDLGDYIRARVRRIECGAAPVGRPAVVCDRCNEKLTGVRPKGLNCYGFDFCGECIAHLEKRTSHTPSHTFWRRLQNRTAGY